MSSIRSKNTKIELVLRKALWKSGCRFRVHYHIKGSPDIAFTKQRLAIFVDGNFWHGYSWRKLMPRLKNKYWVNKIKRNMQRDRTINKKLAKEGWKVMRIWEHQVHNDPEKCLRAILKRLK